jgi:hypothetical protein
MFNSAVLDVAIGLVFVFLGVSLITSVVTEALASAFKWRSASLVAGVKAMLNDQSFTGLARDIYNHAATNPCAPGTAVNEAQLRDKPSYIDPTQFANALIDSAGLVRPAAAGVENAVGAVKDPQLKKFLDGVVQRSAGDVNKIRDELAAWFNQSMDRVSGAYKRKTQLVNFVCAAILVLGLNIDALYIGKVLWQRPAISHESIDLSQEKPEEVLANLSKLSIPFGWNAADFAARTQGVGWLLVIAGWLITAAATLFGAPFWFDALSRIASLRGTGPVASSAKS